jgi:iron complex transport system permease protein
LRWTDDHSGDGTVKADQDGSLKTGLVILVAILFVLSLLAGKVWLPPSDLFHDGPAAWIVLDLRLPRAILGLFIGAGLGLSGAVLQGYLRNPLADPSIVGISSTAALGAVIAIFLGAAVSPAIVFGSAMVGAGLAVLLLVAMGGRGTSPLVFILAGTVLSSLSGALTAFLISIAPNPFATSEIITWLMGALTDRSMADAMRAVPLIVVGVILLLTTGRALDALTLGEDAARSLGIDMRWLQGIIVLGLCLTVGASVAVSGVVGFVGLIVPHIARRFIGERPSAILLPSALGGAALVLAADSLVRLTPGAGEVRLGIAMALIGAPFFFFLLKQLRGKFS